MFKKENNYYEEEINSDKEIDKIVKDYYNDYKDEELLNKGIKQNLNNNQKIAIVVLSFFAIIVIIMWFIQFKYNLEKPFNNFSINQNYKQQVNNACSGPNCFLQNENDLRNKDTDKDGLSDWDELNIYYTSPYLEDTDSDGFSDKEEIDSGNDPNCPAGRNCYNQNNKTVNKNQLDISNSKNENLPLDTITNGLNLFSDNELENILNGQADVEMLRQALINSGVSKEALNKVSDEDLLKAYQQMLNNK